jgi:transcriptional regulator with XRE-family HTH domain
MMDTSMDGWLRRTIIDCILKDGHPVRVWREQRALTLAFVAKRTKIDSARLLDLEAETARPTRDELDRLATIFGAPLDLLMVEGDSEDEEPVDDDGVDLGLADV